MKKTIISIISLLLAALMLGGCVKNDDNTASGTTTSTTTAATTTAGDPDNKEPENTFENKILLKTDNFKIDSKMIKYFYKYMQNIYYQYYGQSYVSPEALTVSAKDLLVYCEAAHAAGYSLTSSELTEIADTITEVESSLKESGYETFADYYGEGVDAEALVEMLKIQFLSQKYIFDKENEIYDTLAADKAALEAYYDANKTLLFGTYVSATIEDEAYFTRLADITSKEEMTEIVNEYCDKQGLIPEDVMGEQAAYYPALKEGESLSEVQAWFFSGDREKGDIYVDVEEKTVFIVSLPAKKHSELLKNAGHILIIPEGNTEAYKNAAKTRAEAILDEYLAGEKTKEAFAALGEKNTSDGNVFYNNIYLGQMVEPFSDWVYDEAREPGDTGIVETAYGYHIMYFVGDGELKNYEYFAIQKLYEKSIDGWNTEITALYPVTADTEAISNIILMG